MDKLTGRIQNYRIDYSLIMMFFFLTFFTLVGIYCTNILPHAAGGFREHPCFCLGAVHEQKSVKKPRNKSKEAFEDHAEIERKFYNFERIYRAKYEKQKESGNVLRIRGLTKCYGGTTNAVDGLNVNMYGGEIFALLGHNGAGKTTTIKIIIGELEATSGQMMFMNKNLALNRKTLQPKIGICPQDNILYGTLTVAEHFTLFDNLRSTVSEPEEEEKKERPKLSCK